MMIRLAALCGLALALAGCSSVDPEALADRHELQALKARVPAPHRVLLLSPTLETTADATPDEDALRAPLRFDATLLEEELVPALRRVLEASDGVAVAGDVTLDEAIAQAARDGQDLLVAPRVRRWDAAFLGTNGLWYFNALLLGWYFWPIGPQWWMADELFGVDCELTFDVIDVASERPVPGFRDRRVVVRSDPAAEDDEGAVPTLALDDLDRGPDLFGTYRPGALDGDQWEKVGALLEPYARRHAAVGLAAALAEVVPALASPELATCHALVLGASDSSAAPGGSCLEAVDDARAVQQALSQGDREARWAPPKNVRALVGAEATTAQALAHLDRLAGASSPDDLLMIHASGRGQRVEGAGLAGFTLLLADGRLDLSTLLARARAVPARARLIVLDVDFDGGPRGLPAGGGAPDLPDLAGLLERALGEGDAVLLACAPTADEAAQSFDGRGALTSYLLDALAHGDAGDDGLTAADLEAHVTRGVLHLSSVALPSLQEPRLVAGAGRKEGLLLRRARGDAAARTP